MKPPFEILYEDEAVVAIRKPSGILVHRTRISEDKSFVLQNLRDQLGGKWLHPLHRLDRGTSGVLLFAKSPETAAFAAEQFREHKVQKTYHALVRGFVEESDWIDHALFNEKRTTKLPARTHYRKLAQCEIPIPVGRYPTARYSWVEVSPETGRFHQIRRHFSHIRHPVIGDKKHGDVKHNHFFRDTYGIERLLLHATCIRLTGLNGKPLEIDCPPDAAFMTLLSRLGLLET